MKRVMEALWQREAEEKLPVIRLEIDYELMTLYDAMMGEDEEQIARSKQRLNELRSELLQWMT